MTLLFRKRHSSAEAGGKLPPVVVNATGTRVYYQAFREVRDRA
jgi:hypothetical protein